MLRTGKTTRAQLARELGVAADTVRDWTAYGLLGIRLDHRYGTERVGGRVLYSWEGYRAWLADVELARPAKDRRRKTKPLTMTRSKRKNAAQEKLRILGVNL